MRDDAPGTTRKDEDDDASEQAKAKARAAAGDHERGLVPGPEEPPSSSDQADGSPRDSGDAGGAATRGVKGDPAK
jgi:hypothetical protein